MSSSFLKTWFSDYIFTVGGSNLTTHNDINGKTELFSHANRNWKTKEDYPFGAEYFISWTRLHKKRRRTWYKSFGPWFGSLSWSNGWTPTPKNCKSHVDHYTCMYWAGRFSFFFWRYMLSGRFVVLPFVGKLTFYTICTSNDWSWRDLQKQPDLIRQTRSDRVWLI